MDVANTAVANDELTGMCGGGALGELSGVGGGILAAAVTELK